jgi:hypothetical protein
MCGLKNPESTFSSDMQFSTIKLDFAPKLKVFTVEYDYYSCTWIRDTKTSYTQNSLFFFAMSLK